MIRSNFGNGITIGLFAFLKNHNEDYDPFSIFKWAVNNQWTPEDAEILKNISQKVLRGINYNEIPSWTEKDLKKWRDQCNK